MAETGIAAPPNTVLIQSDQWMDGTLRMRPGSTLTADSSSTTTINGSMEFGATSTATFVEGSSFTFQGTNTFGTTNVSTFDGTVAFNGITTFAHSSQNDLTSAISPSSYGLTAYNFPYQFATGTGSAVTTAGTLYLAKVPLMGSTTVNRIWFNIATAASGLTTGQNFAGIYNRSGVRQATTADLTTTIGTNTGAINAPLTAAFTTPTGGDFYWIGVFFNSGTTFPVLTCYTGQVTVTTSVANFGSTTTFGNTAATYPFAVSSTTGNTTAMPATITMSGNTATGAYPFWVGVS